MFRVKAEALPPDASEPADLKQLGYFVNEIGQIRMIDFPDKDYLYHWYNTERHNEVRREAMQICQRKEVDIRLTKLGIERLYLPELTNTKPDGPHVPILAPPVPILKTRKRIILLINDSLQDLGILAYRRLQRELGVNGGSVVNFTKEVIQRSFQATGKEETDIFKDGAGVGDKKSDTPGLIVMNCGQLVYSHKYNQAMTNRTWCALPRKSICHDIAQIHEVHNHLKGNADAKEHIRYVFQHVICNNDLVSPDAEVYVIAIENGAENTLEILNSQFEVYSSRVNALALINAYVIDSQITNPKLKNFLQRRARHWKVATSSNDPYDCIEIPDKDVSNVQSDGDSPPTPSDQRAKLVLECINWLELVDPSSVQGLLASSSAKVEMDFTPPDSSTFQGSFEEIDRNDDFASNKAICPTFADDDNPSGSGECVFTSAKVQKCILSFFEEVSRSPKTFRNPDFRITVYEPTDNGKYGYADSETRSEASDEEEDNAGFGPLVPLEISSPEYIELRQAKDDLERMVDALKYLPSEQGEALAKGKEKLERRIKWTEREIEKLTQKALATGGLHKGEGKEVRGEWKKVKTGPKIQFAGTTVDSELVRAAGLLDTADEGVVENRELDALLE